MNIDNEEMLINERCNGSCLQMKNCSCIIVDKREEKLSNGNGKKQ